MQPEFTGKPVVDATLPMFSEVLQEGKTYYITLPSAGIGDYATRNLHYDLVHICRGQLQLH